MNCFNCYGKEFCQQQSCSAIKEYFNNSFGHNDPRKGKTMNDNHELNNEHGEAGDVAVAHRGDNTITVRDEVIGYVQLDEAGEINEIVVEGEGQEG